MASMALKIPCSQNNYNSIDQAGFILIGSKTIVNNSLHTLSFPILPPTNKKTSLAVSQVKDTIITY